MQCVINGNPKGKDRPRFFQKFGRVQVVTPKATHDYEEYVAQCWRNQCGYHCYQRGVPLAVTVEAYFAIPKTVPHQVGDPVLKCPDADNIAKIILDGLNGVAYEDDASICELHVYKQYAWEPCVVVTINPIYMKG